MMGMLVTRSLVMSPMMAPAKALDGAFTARSELVYLHHGIVRCCAGCLCFPGTCSGGCMDFGVSAASVFLCGVGLGGVSGQCFKRALKRGGNKCG